MAIKCENASATVIMLSADHEWFVVFQECCGKGVNGCCVTVNQNGTANNETQNGTANNETQNGDINVSFLYT